MQSQPSLSPAELLSRKDREYNKNQFDLFKISRSLCAKDVIIIRVIFTWAVVSAVLHLYPIEEEPPFAFN